MNINKNSKIFVAGHKGLVGSAIWNNLLEKGYSNLIGRTHKELDLTSSQDVEDFFSKEKPEIVILAAAHVGGIYANLIDRADFIYNNLAIEINVIGASYRHSVQKLVFLGSACIYPKVVKQPITEDDLLTGPLEYTNEPYAIAKIAGIKMCESFNIQYGTNFISIMPTNLYGPNDNFDLQKSHVLPAILRKVYLGKLLMKNEFEKIKKDLTKRPIENVNGLSTKEEILMILNKYGIRDHLVEIWGTGKPKREFLWSEEMADATVFIMENVNFIDTYDKDQTEIRNCHINVGTGKDISIHDLSLLIKKIVGYSGELVFNPSKPDGTMLRLSDVSKLHSLGWTHKIEVEEGIQKLLDWYINN